MKKTNQILIVVLLVFTLIAAFFIFTTKPEEVKTEQTAEVKNEPEEEPKKDITFTITALGDVLCHNTQYWDAEDKATGTYDFSYVFENIKQYTSAGDYNCKFRNKFC